MRIKELEMQKGDLDRVIPALVNQHGQHRAAAILGISAATVNKWLKDNGYTLKLVYVKQESAGAS